MFDRCKNAWVIESVSVAMTAGIFVIDLLTPLGYSVWLLYLLPMGLAVWTRWAGWPFVLAGLISVLIGLGFYLSPPGVSGDVALINRLIGVALFWTSAVSLGGRNNSESDRPIFNLSRPIIANLASVCLIVILLGSVTYRIAAESREAEGRVAHTHEVLAELSLALSSLKDAETGQRGFLLTGQDRYLEPYNRAVTEIGGRHERLKRLTQDNQLQQDRLLAIEAKIEEKLAELGDTVIARRTQGPEAARRIVESDRGKAIMDAIRRLAAEMEDTERGLLVQRVRQSAIMFQSQQMALLAGGLALAGLMTAVVVLLRKEHIARRDRAAAIGRTQAILDATIDGMFIFDPRTLRFTYLNEGAVQQTGYSREELLCMTPLDIMPEFDETKFRDALAPLESGAQRLQSVRAIHRRKDGIDVPVEINLQCIGRGMEQPSMVGIVRDITARQRAEEALRKAAEEIRDLYDHAPCGYHSLDPDGLFLNVNQTELDWLGFRREELVGKRKWLDVVTPESAARFRAMFPIFKQRGRVDDLEFDLIRKDGSLMRVSLSATAVMDEAGTYVQSRSTLFDITERKRAESERDRFFALSLDLLCIAHKDGYFKRVSPSFTQTLGWSTEELLSRPLLDFVHPDDHAATLREIETQVASGEPILQFENRYRHKDESWRILSWKSVSLPDGTIYATARDVTEQKKAEERLRQLASIVDSSDDAIIGQTLDGIVINWNRGAVHLYGYAEEEIIGKQVTVLLPPDRADEEALIIARLRQGESLDHFETVRRRKDGRLVDVSLMISPIRDARGTVAGISKIARNISDRKQAEKELLRRGELLEAANKELEAFSYSVSHDLRTPLRSIDGFSQALLEDCADRLSEQGKDYLNRIRAASQRMGQLIDDLLQLSRLTRQELRREPVDLSAVALSRAEEVRKLWPDHHVELRVEPGLQVRGDRRLLEILFDNLLDNAWKFTGKRDGARIEVGAVAHNGAPAFFVRDNGAGFDMAYAGKLFGAFQRLHDLTDYPGTGVGLATVQRIVARHGGRVWAEGRVNRGAIFYFTLDD